LALGALGVDLTKLTILAGATVGLLAVTLGRLYSSAFYALRDTRTPLRFALLRLVLTAAGGWLCALVLPGLIGVSRGWGAAGLTASAGIVKPRLCKKRKNSFPACS
jgi:putative peptidoglycan lipid II flippase